MNWALFELQHRVFVVFLLALVIRWRLSDLNLNTRLQLVW